MEHFFCIQTVEKKKKIEDKKDLHVVPPQNVRKEQAEELSETEWMPLFVCMLFLCEVVYWCNLLSEQGRSVSSEQH